MPQEKLTPEEQAQADDFVKDNPPNLNICPLCRKPCAVPGDTAHAACAGIKSDGHPYPMKPVKTKGWAFVDSDGDILGFSHPNLGGSIQHIFEDENEAEMFRQKINSPEFRIVPVSIRELAPKSRKR